MNVSGGAVTVLDFDDDRDPGLFVEVRVLTCQYPESPRSYLLRNNGGVFEDVTAEIAPGLMRPGQVTDAVWADMDGDGQNELIVTGEWMPIRVFKMNRGTYHEITRQAGLENTAGWWNTLAVADLTGNGLPDIIAGNRGLNTGLQTSVDEPVILYHGDFNNNGLNDPLITYMVDGIRRPFPERDLFLQQLPSFREQFPDYASWAQATVSDIIRNSRRRPAEYPVHTFESSVFLNNGDGTFERKPLPRKAQTAPIFDVFVADFFENGQIDILAAGNNFGTRPEIGPMADQGLILMGKGNGEFDVIPPHETGFYAIGDVRSIELVSTPIGPLFLLGRYGEGVLPYLYRGLRE